MKKAFPVFSFLFAAFLFLLPNSSFASVGVSVNTGKIVVEKELVAGGTYALPAIQVTNSGTVSSDYSIVVQYNDVQKEIKPNANWFHFDPTVFHLEPGESKLVKINMTLATNALPGDYFGYLEAHAVKSDGGGTSISGAAATKLYFSVEKTNVFKTSYLGIVSFVQNNSPWTYVLVWLIAGVLVFLIVKKIRAAIVQAKR
jgi:hypothetical protein